MVRSRLKAKGRRESGAFVPLPVSVLNHANFTRLSPKAVKLLLDLCSQLRFKQGGAVNNGDLCAAFSVMQARGWKSEETLANAVSELLHYGFVSVTRQGGKNRCYLYAVTWWAIDECSGKLDVKETPVPTNDWRHEREDFVSAYKQRKAQEELRKGSDTKKSVPRNSEEVTSKFVVTAEATEARDA